MREFNLEEALAGKPVVTRNGHKVDQLKKYDVESRFNLYGVLLEEIIAFSESGKYSKPPNVSLESEYDLFMKSEKKEGWINIYAGGRSGCTFTNKEGALKQASGRVLDTIKIQWEE